MIRKRFILAGASLGVLHSVLGMMAFYMDSAQSAGWAQVVMEFVVVSLFTAPLGGTIGLGIGLLVEGLVNKLRRGRELRQES